MPSKKKKYNARFPPARIKKIMQMDEEVGKVAATVPVIISRALELFIESLLKQATQMTVSKNAKTLSASHLKHTIESQEKYKFLRELVANIPDYQAEEDAGAGCSTNCNNGEESGPTILGKRPRGRPRKPKDGNQVILKVRRKRRKDYSSSESENSEETDEADEGTDEEPVPAGSAGISATATTTTTISTPSSPSATTTEAEPQPPAITTTTLTNPPPISELLAQSQDSETLEVQQQQQQDQQQLQGGSAPASLASTFQAPAMMPAAMPMYQSMPGTAPPHLFTWPTSPGLLAGGGFPSLPAGPQGSAFAGLQPQGPTFPGVMLPGIGFPGVPAPLMGFHGLPGTGFAGVSPLGPGFSGVNAAGSGLSGMPSRPPAMAGGASSGAQGDDDYDT